MNKLKEAVLLIEKLIKQYEENAPDEIHGEEDSYKDGMNDGYCLALELIKEHLSGGAWADVRLLKEDGAFCCHRCISCRIINHSFLCRVNRTIFTRDEEKLIIKTSSRPAWCPAYVVEAK